MAGGEQKIIMYRGTPAQFFFQSIDLAWSFSSEFYKGGDPAQNC